MLPMGLASIALIVIPVSWMTWLVFSDDRASLRKIQQNLGGNRSAAAPRANFGEQFTELVKKLTPSSYEAWIDRQLAAAGRPRDWPLGRVIMIKPMLALVGAALGLIVIMGQRAPLSFFIGILATALGYFVPDLLIRSKAETRRKRIRTDLPNAMDQMLISVQAGLGFEGAMARAAEYGRGPLAEELVRTLQDIQVGRSRKEAYLAFADRNDVQEVRSFVRAIIQADTYGVAIAKVLGAQARELRIKRRQTAEENAMKLPVKLLFPLMFFIMPALFIILLGPAVMNIVQTFMNMSP